MPMLRTRVCRIAAPAAAARCGGRGSGGCLPSAASLSFSWSRIELAALNSPDGQVMSYKLHHKLHRAAVAGGSNALQEAGVLDGDDSAAATGNHGRPDVNTKSRRTTKEAFWRRANSEGHR